jgi:hypothetical protein
MNGRKNDRRSVTVKSVRQRKGGEVIVILGLGQEPPYVSRGKKVKK